MYDLAGLVTHISTTTGYTVKLVDGKEPTGLNLSDTPLITVGYHSVGVSDLLGSGDYIAPMIAYAENMFLTFFVQINCSVVSFPDVWRVIQDSVSGWTPLPKEANYSGILPMGQISKNVVDGRQLWMSYFKIEMPSVTQSF